MATTQNNTVSPTPLPQKRGLDANTKRRLESMSGEFIGGDQSLLKDLYIVTSTFTKKPGKVLKDKNFPVVIFTIMIVIDIADIIVGFFDITGIGYLIRILLLNVLPILIVLAWAGREGKKFKEELDGAVDKLLKAARTAHKAASSLERKAGTKAAKKAAVTGAKAAGKTQAGKKIKERIAKRIRIQLTKKMFWKILRIFLYGLIPIIAFFSLWSYFIFAFHKKRMEMTDETNDSLNKMYEMQVKQNML